MAQVFQIIELDIWLNIKIWMILGNLDTLWAVFIFCKNLVKFSAQPKQSEGHQVTRHQVPGSS